MTEQLSETVKLICDFLHLKNKIISTEYNNHLNYRAALQNVCLSADDTILFPDDR